MGAVSLTNLTGSAVVVKDFSINNTSVVVGTPEIESQSSLDTEYNDKSWNDYQIMNLDVELNDVTYHVNLNRDHYFGGGDFRYPGMGSDVNFVLFGTNSEESNIQFLLSYQQSGATLMTYSSDDSKKLDAK